MSKISRFVGNLLSFGSNASGTNRTVFGDVTQSDVITDNVNADFLAGWQIVSASENPTKQDFNAMGFTLGQILAYLHQMGVPEWDILQEYYLGSISNRAGVLYVSQGTNTGNVPETDSGTNWLPLISSGPSDVVNGQFRVAQAGSSFPAAASGAYDLDGWINQNTSAAILTIAKANGSSTGKFARKVTFTTPDATVANADYASQVTLVEGVDCVKYLGATFTVGFRAKSSVIGTHCVTVYNGTSAYVTEYTIDVADTWEYKTVTIAGGTPLLNSALPGDWGIVLRWANLTGSDRQTTAGTWNAGNFHGTSNQVNDAGTINNIFELEDVTLNLGDHALADDISYDADLHKCKRYYEESNGVSNSIARANSATDFFGGTLTYTVAKMGATPTVVISGATLQGGTLGTIVVSSKDYGFRLTSTDSSGLSTGDALHLDYSWTAASRL